MKKTIITAVVAILCLSFSGCQKATSAQYDEETNRRVEFQGIRLQVPAEWKVPDVEFGEDTIAFAKWPEGESFPTRYLSLRIAEDQDIPQALEEKTLAIEQGEEQGLHLENYKQSEQMISGCDAVRIEYSQELDGQTYQCREVMLETDRGVIWILFSSTESIGLEDFEKVIGSIETQ